MLNQRPQECGKEKRQKLDFLKSEVKKKILRNQDLYKKRQTLEFRTVG